MSKDSNYWQRRSLSRRMVLRGAAVGGLGLAGAALIGCGGESSKATPTATAATAKGTAAATAAAAAVKPGGTGKVLITNDPPTIDPYGNLSFQTKTVDAYAYSRLYKIAVRPDQNPQAVGSEPDVAASAETQDGQNWVVKLKPGIKFHNVAPVNGREMTADDVLFSWKRLTDPKSPGKDLVKNVTSVSVVDDHTLKFALDAPTATFLDMLSDTNILYIMPKEADGKFDPAKTMIGSGPFILDSYQTSKVFKWKKNPDYWDKPKPYLDAVETSIIPEYANRLAQFQTGNVHVAVLLADDVLPLKKDQPKVQWRGLLSPLLSFTYFEKEETAPKAVWRDPRFRQAVSMTQDRAALTELAGNVKKLKDAGLDVATSWNNLVPSGFTSRWWLDPQGKDMGPAGKYFGFDLAEAKKLLDASGYKGEAIKYQYSNNIYGATFNSVAEAAANFLSQGGVKVTVETQDYNSQYVTQTFRSNFKGIAFGYETPFPEVGGYFPRMFGDDPANHGRISDPQITDLMKKQAVELNAEKRKQFIYDIQRRNAEMMYYVPNQAGAVTAWTAYRPELRGITQTRGYGGASEDIPNFWLDV